MRISSWAEESAGSLYSNMADRLLQKTRRLSEFCDNCFYFFLHREMIPEKSNFPDTGKCMVFVDQLDGFVLPCPVDLHQVKSDI